MDMDATTQVLHEQWKEADTVRQMLKASDDHVNIVLDNAGIDRDNETVNRVDELVNERDHLRAVLEQIAKLANDSRLRQMYELRAELEKIEYTAKHYRENGAG